MTTFDRFEHACFKPGCRGVALFGYDVALLKDRPGQWACAAHRGELEALLASRKAENQPAAEETQGKLL